MRTIGITVVLVSLAVGAASAQTVFQPNDAATLKIVNAAANPVTGLSFGSGVGILPVPIFPAGRTLKAGDYLGSGTSNPGLFKSGLFDLRMHAIDVDATHPTGDAGYFDGSQLFKDIGQGVYNITDPITAKIDPSDPLSQTYQAYYSMPIASQTTGTTTIQTKDVQEQDLKSVLNNFPFGNPKSCVAVTDAQYKKLMGIYYQFIADHMKYHWTTLASPFLLQLPGKGAPLATPQDLLATLLGTAAVGGGTPLTKTVSNGHTVYSGFSGIATTDTVKFYWAEMQAKFFFQQFPSQTSIAMPGGPPPPTPIPRRLPDIDGHQLTIPATAANWPAALNDDTFVTGTATTALPAADDIVAQTPDAGYPASSGFYDNTPADQPTGMKDYILDSLQTIPGVTYSPPGEVSFFSGHDTSPTAKQLDEAAMEVYVVIDAKLYGGADAATAAGKTTADYELKLIDRAAVLTEVYSNAQFTSLTEFNGLLASNACNASAVGDPLKRPSKTVAFPKPTPNQTTGSAAYFPDPNDSKEKDFLDTLNQYSANPVPGDPASKGNVYAVICLGRGPAFNFVYDKDGAQIDPSKGDNPVKYWPNPRHIAAVFPYQAKKADGTTVVLGPYVGRLSEVEDPSNAGSAQLPYVYAHKPWHSDASADDDHCQPICLGAGTALLKAVNAIYEDPSNSQVHMTAKFSTWFNSNNNGFNYSSDIFFASDETDPSKKGFDEQSLYAIVQPYQADPSSNPNNPTIDPLPPGFVPLLPSFPVVQQTNVPGGNSSQKYVASFDAATTDIPSGNTGNFDPPLRDQYVALKVVNGCGAKSELSHTECGGAMMAKPSAAVTIKDVQAGKSFTAGVPIRSSNWVYDLNGSQLASNPIPQYPAASNDSLSSRVTGATDLSNSTSDFTGESTPPSGFINPGSQFFTMPTDEPIVKGHRLMFDVCAESQVPPGLDIWTYQKTGHANYIPYVTKVQMKVIPPSEVAKNTPPDPTKEVPENQFTLYDRSGTGMTGTDLESGSFNTASGESTSAEDLTNAAPPCSEVPYVFREAGNFIVEIDTTDFSGNVRRMRIPITVKDESASVDKISGETEKKN